MTVQAQQLVALPTHLGSSGVFNIAAIGSGSGATQELSYTTVLLGDSQTNNSVNPVGSVTGASYNSSTGVLTITKAGHGLVDGSYIKFTVRADPKWNKYAALVTVPDTSTFSLVVGAGLTGSPTLVDIRYSKMGDLLDNGYQSWLQSSTNGALNVLRNCGVTGELILEIGNRIDNEVFPLKPDLVIFQGGHNDITTTSDSAATMFNNIVTVVTKLFNYGMKVIVLTVTPFATSYGSNTAANRARICELNRLIINKLPELFPNNVYIADAYLRVVDPSSATPGSATANTMNSDGLHWGAAAVQSFTVNEIAPIINLMYPKRGKLISSPFDAYDSTNNPNSSNKMQNGGLLTTTGGTVNNSILGTAASQINIATSANGALLTAVCSASTWDSRWNSQKVSWSTALTYTSGQIIRIYANTQHVRFALGQKVRVRARVKVTGLIGVLEYCALNIFTTLDNSLSTQRTTSVAGSHGYSLNNQANQYQGNIDSYYETDVFYIPQAITLDSLYWQLTCSINGTTATSGSIEIGQISMEVVS